MTVDLEYYFNNYGGNVLNDDDTGFKALKYAFRQIDIVCNNRLLDGTVDDLTEEAQNAVKDIICEQAEFNYANADLINSTLSEYSINGVKIKYQTNAQIANYNGVLIKKMLYDELNFYGLTYRGF